MSEEKEFAKCVLFMGVLSTAEEHRQKLFSLLEKEFGQIETVSPSVSFSFTSYYNHEMRGEPKRYFLIFSNLIDPQKLATIKETTDSLEKVFADSEGRRINLDPGLLSLHNIILATTKNRSHRIPLSDGIYGEVTLIYQDKTFNPLPWTYADYSSKEVIDFFCEQRNIFKQKRKQKTT